MAAVCRRYLVEGRVQGVAYRAFVQHHALRLNLRGFTRNRSDGSVEVIACGDVHAFADLETHLRAGPLAARVTAVHQEDAPDAGYRGFGIRKDE